MKERPILFSAPMVCAILDGGKTQTRRIVKPQPPDGFKAYHDGYPSTLHMNHGGYERRDGFSWDLGICGPEQRFWPSMSDSLFCPYGQPGDRLWVRETFCPIYPQDPTYNGGQPIEYDYAATYKHGDRLGDALGIKKVWKPSIHMPRAASRILLQVTSVRVERLQDCSETDAIAEGIEPVGCNWRDYMDHPYNNFTRARSSYRSLWELINGAGSWDTNPWVWVVEFKPVGLGIIKE